MAGTDNTGGLEFGPSDESLQEQLRAYKAALEEEFEANDLSSALDPAKNPEKHTRQFFRQNLSNAAAQIVWLSGNSTSDSVRLNASKYIVSEALADSREEHDPVKELFESLLKGNPNEKAEA